MPTTIQFPASPDIRSALRFFDTLNEIDSEQELNIDFRNMGRTEPFTLIFISRAIREYNRRNIDTKIFCSNFKDKTYPANMGFFQSFGLPFGKKPGDALGSRTYLPITVTAVQNIIDEALETWEPEQNIVERNAEKLAAILSRSSSEEVKKTLAYSITEIIRNIVEHSKSKDIMFSAQYWKTYNKVEISVLDSGIGLKQSFETNPYVSPANDIEAIQLAMMPGISSKFYKGIKSDRNDKWQNSGFGLYMLSRLSRNGGEMAVVSGNHGILQDRSNGKEHFPLKTHFQGTAVKIVLEADKIHNLHNLQLKFREEGWKIAKEIEGVGNIDSAKASQLITRDFC